MDANKLNNVAIVAVEGAERLGRVKEVLFEADPLRVAALKASGDAGDFLVPRERIRKFGADAVMVDTPEVRRLADPGGPGLHSLSTLNKLKVVDENGTYLGTVNTIEFDPDSGRVERVTATTGGVLGVGGSTATITANGIRSVGTELLTVASASDERATAKRLMRTTARRESPPSAPRQTHADPAREERPADADEAVRTDEASESAR